MEGRGEIGTRATSDSAPRRPGRAPAGETVGLSAGQRRVFEYSRILPPGLACSKSPGILPVRYRAILTSGFPAGSHWPSENRALTHAFQGLHCIYSGSDTLLLPAKVIPRGSAMLKASQKASLVKKKPSVRAAEKRAREAEAAVDTIFRARHKYAELISRCSGLFEYSWGGFTLVSAPGADEAEEGLFEAEELAMVPTRQLYDGLTALEEAQEVLAAMIEQVQEALDARPE